MNVWRLVPNMDPILGPKAPLPLGPNARTDAEYSAQVIANYARDASQQSIDYMGDVGKRLRRASEKAAIAFTPAPTLPPPPPPMKTDYELAVEGVRAEMK